MTIAGLPITMASPIQHDGPLPEAVDIAIVGGGVIGVTTALYLARKGIRVALFEKGRIAGEQSARNWGWIRQTGRDFAELPIAQEANRLWHALSDELGAGLGLQRIGLGYLAKTDAELEEYAKWLPKAQELGVDSRLLSSKETSAFFPDAVQRFKGALHTPSDLRAEPWMAVPLIAKAAAAAGALIRESCAVRALDTQAGRITGVITEKGRVAAGQVLVAGGAWSALLLRRHGVHIPQLSVTSTVCATHPLPQVARSGATAGDIAFRPRADGGYTLAPSGYHEFSIGPDAFRAFGSYLPQLRSDPFGRRYRAGAPKGYPDAWSTPRKWSQDRPSPFEAMRMLDPAPTKGKAQESARRFAQLFPGLGEVRLKAVWGGMIDTMPDVVPVVDSALKYDGLWICTGMCGHGFGIGPAFGRIMSDLMTGQDCGHDLDRFRLSRFSDGSTLELGPEL